MLIFTNPSVIFKREEHLVSCFDKPGPSLLRLSRSYFINLSGAGDGTLGLTHANHTLSQ